MQSSFQRLQDNLEDTSSDTIQKAAKELFAMAESVQPDPEQWTPWGSILQGAAEMLNRILQERR